MKHKLHPMVFVIDVPFGVLSFMLVVQGLAGLTFYKYIDYHDLNAFTVHSRQRQTSCSMCLH